MITLLLHTEHEELTDIAPRYWALDATGSWLETVTALSAAKNIPASKIPKYVHEASTAYLDDVLCKSCMEPYAVKNRADFNRLNNYNKKYTCKGCLKNEHDAEIQRQKDEDLIKKNLIHIELKKLSDREFDFSKISFMDAVYCHVIQEASGCSFYDEIGSIENGNFFITPTQSKTNEIFQNLFRKQILTISENSPYSAFNIDEDGTIKYTTSKVNWIFSNDARNLDKSIIHKIIYETLEKPDFQSLCNIWNKIAQDECESYFYEMCERYNLNNWSYTEKVAESIDYALNKYSIPQVWNFIFGEFKNLAALVQAKTYNKRHIENMFSGNIRRRVDRAVANGWNMTPWARRAFDRESYLTSFVFDNLFGGGNRDWDGITKSNVAIRAEEVVSASHF